MRKYGKAVLFLLGGMMVGLYAYSALQTPDQVFDEIRAFREGDSAVIQVRFSMAVRYQNHFPEGQGDMLQIKLRPVALGAGEQNERLGLDRLAAGLAEPVPLTDVAYEGNVPGGPFLTLRFSRPVHFDVREDFEDRSIVVFVPRSDFRPR